MSQMIKSPHGLKYTLSDDMYLRVQAAEEQLGNIWTTLNVIIESSAIMPQFFGFLAYTIFSFQPSVQWYMVVVYALIAYLIGYALHHQVRFLKNPIVFVVLGLFTYISTWLIDVIAIIAISIWQMHHWEAALIYCIGYLVIMRALTGSYKSREFFNDSVAEMVIKTFANAAS